MSLITLKGIIDEDFVNYKVPSMSLMFPKCSFKCDRQYCQNASLIDEPDITIAIDDLCKRYINNPITKAVVCQGLEPLDSIDDLINFIATLRYKYNCDDDVVIYTGYNRNEIIPGDIGIFRDFNNIIIKYGRYVHGFKSHFDPVLGVYLASDNQYAERIL